jgi:pimeloyl-ACP methyl ester carboxylesterase
MKSLLAIFVLVGVCFLTVCEGQTLPRKGMIGVVTKVLDEPTARANDLKTGEGLIVTVVVPNGTLADFGVKVGDIITSVNQKTFGRHEELVAFAQTINEGDPLEVSFISGGTKLTKNGAAKPRPRETSDYAEVRYGAVDFDLGTLRTITHIPKGKSGRLPTIFYLQGYPCGSQEFPPNSKSALKMALDDWVKAGYVVYRVERPNMGDSRTRKDCRDTDYDEELAGNIAAYQKLLKEDFVDTSNVFLFGHSLGSVTAPLLAATFQPKGIIVYGVVLRSWFEYFLDIHRTQTTYFGLPRAEAERNTRNLLPLYYEWLELGKGPEELKRNPEFKAILEAPNNPMNASGNYFFGRHYKFWHTMNKKRLTEAWSKVTGKVLSVYAEFDVQAINSTDAENIAKVVNEAHPGNGEFLLLPKTEHIFLKVDSYREVAELSATGKMAQAINERYNPEVGIKTVEWLEKVRKGSLNLSN